jgi:hypothetical protein
MFHSYRWHKKHGSLDKFWKHMFLMFLPFAMYGMVKFDMWAAEKAQELYECSQQ